MFLDNEGNAINYILHGLDHYNVLQYDGNSFNKKILISSLKTTVTMLCRQITIQTSSVVCLM